MIQFGKNKRNKLYDRSHRRNRFSRKSKNFFRILPKQLYYKRKRFINRLGFLTKMKVVWDKLYLNKVKNKFIDLSSSPFISSESVKTYSNDLESLLLFNKFWRKFKNVSHNNLPLWNFRGFDKKLLGLKCSWDTGSADNLSLKAKEPSVFGLRLDFGFINFFRSFGGLVFFWAVLCFIILLGLICYILYLQKKLFPEFGSLDDIFFTYFKFYFDIFLSTTYDYGARRGSAAFLASHESSSFFWRSVLEEKSFKVKDFVFDFGQWPWWEIESWFGKVHPNILNINADLSYRWGDVMEGTSGRYGYTYNSAWWVKAFYLHILPFLKFHVWFWSPLVLDYYWFFDLWCYEAMWFIGETYPMFLQRVLWQELWIEAKPYYFYKDNSFGSLYHYYIVKTLDRWVDLKSKIFGVVWKHKWLDWYSWVELCKIFTVKESIEIDFLGEWFRNSFIYKSSIYSFVVTLARAYPDKIGIAKYHIRFFDLQRWVYEEPLIWFLIRDYYWFFFLVDLWNKINVSNQFLFMEMNKSYSLWMPGETFRWKLHRYWDFREMLYKIVFSDIKYAGIDDLAQFLLTITNSIPGFSWVFSNTVGDVFINDYDLGQIGVYFQSIEVDVWLNLWQQLTLLFWGISSGSIGRFSQFIDWNNWIAETHSIYVQELFLVDLPWIWEENFPLEDLLLFSMLRLNNDLNYPIFWIFTAFNTLVFEYFFCRDDFYLNFDKFFMNWDELGDNYTIDVFGDDLVFWNLIEEFDFFEYMVDEDLEFHPYNYVFLGWVFSLFGKDSVDYTGYVVDIFSDVVTKNLSLFELSVWGGWFFNLDSLYLLEFSEFSLFNPILDYSTWDWENSVLVLSNLPFDFELEIFDSILVENFFFLLQNYSFQWFRPLSSGFFLLIRDLMWFLVDFSSIWSNISDIALEEKAFLRFSEFGRIRLAENRLLFLLQYVYFKMSLISHKALILGIVFDEEGRTHYPVSPLEDRFGNFLFLKFYDQSIFENLLLSILDTFYIEIDKWTLSGAQQASFFDWFIRFSLYFGFKRYSLSDGFLPYHYAFSNYVYWNHVEWLFNERLSLMLDENSVYSLQVSRSTYSEIFERFLIKIYQNLFFFRILPVAEIQEDSEFILLFKGAVWVTSFVWHYSFFWLDFLNYAGVVHFSKTDLFDFYILRPKEWVRFFYSWAVYFVHGSIDHVESLDYLGYLVPEFYIEDFFLESLLGGEPVNFSEFKLMHQMRTNILTYYNEYFVHITELAKTGNPKWFTNSRLVFYRSLYTDLYSYVEIWGQDGYILSKALGNSWEGAMPVLGQEFFINWLFRVFFEGAFVQVTPIPMPGIYPYFNFFSTKFIIYIIIHFYFFVNLFEKSILEDFAYFIFIDDLFDIYPEFGRKFGLDVVFISVIFPYIYNLNLWFYTVFLPWYLTYVASIELNMYVWDRSLNFFLSDCIDFLWYRDEFWHDLLMEDYWARGLHQVIKNQTKPFFFFYFTGKEPASEFGFTPDVYRKFAEWYTVGYKTVAHTVGVNNLMLNPKSFYTIPDAVFTADPDIYYTEWFSPSTAGKDKKREFLYMASWLLHQFVMADVSGIQPAYADIPYGLRVVLYDNSYISKVADLWWLSFITPTEYHLGYIHPDRLAEMDGKSAHIIWILMFHNFSQPGFVGFWFFHDIILIFFAAFVFFVLFYISFLFVAAVWGVVDFWGFHIKFMYPGSALVSEEYVEDFDSIIIYDYGLDFFNEYGKFYFSGADGVILPYRRYVEDSLLKYRINIDTPRLGYDEVFREFLFLGNFFTLKEISENNVNGVVSEKRSDNILKILKKNNIRPFWDFLMWDKSEFEKDNVLSWYTDDAKSTLKLFLFCFIFAYAPVLWNFWVFKWLFIMPRKIHESLADTTMGAVEPMYMDMLLDVTFLLSVLLVVIFFYILYFFCKNLLARLLLLTFCLNVFFGCLFSVLLVNLLGSFRFWQGRLFYGVGSLFLIHPNRNSIEDGHSNFIQSRFGWFSNHSSDYHGKVYDSTLFLKDMGVLLYENTSSNKVDVYPSLPCIGASVDPFIKKLVVNDVHIADKLTAFTDLNRELIWFKDEVFLTLLENDRGMVRLAKDSQLLRFSNPKSGDSSALLLVDFSCFLNENVSNSYMVGNLSRKLYDFNWSMGSYLGSLDASHDKKTPIIPPTPSFWSQKKLKRSLNRLKKNSVVSDAFLRVGLIFEKLPYIDDDFLNAEYDELGADPNLYVQDQSYRQDFLLTVPNTRFADSIENLSERSVFEKSTDFLSVDDAWGFVDINSKVDVSSKNRAKYRQDFYSQLYSEKIRRSKANDLWVDFDVLLSDNYKNKISPKGHWNSGFRNSFYSTFYGRGEDSNLYFNLEGDVSSAKFLRKPLGYSNISVNRAHLFARPFSGDDKFDLE